MKLVLAIILNLFILSLFMLNNSFALDDFDRDLFSRPGAKECMNEFMREAHRFDNRIRSVEVSMWLVEGIDQSVSCIFWPMVNNNRKQSVWRGAIPEGVLANVHSHPGQVIPGVSVYDIAVSVELGVPVYAVCSRGRWMYKAVPEMENQRPPGVKVGSRPVRNTLSEIGN